MMHARHVYDLLIRSYRARRKNFNLDLSDAIYVVARSLRLRPSQATWAHVKIFVTLPDFATGFRGAVNDYCPYMLTTTSSYDVADLIQHAAAPYSTRGPDVRFHSENDAIFFRLMWPQ